MTTNEQRKFFIKEFPTANGGMLRICYNRQSETPEKPILVRTVDKNGTGKEIIYQDGRVVLEVGLKNYKPYGRAKMYDKDGVQTFPNTYWYYGHEINSGRDFFGQQEKAEKDLLEEEKKELQANTDNDKIHEIQKKYQKLIENIYSEEEIGCNLKIRSLIETGKDSGKRSLLKNFFEKDR